jgi:hypothetical protein
VDAARGRIDRKPDFLDGITVRSPSVDAVGTITFIPVSMIRRT